MGNIASQFVGLKGGLAMSAIAFSIVFLVIAGLMLVMIALKHSAKLAGPGKTTGIKEKSAAADAHISPPIVSRAVPADSAESDENEITAVIAAAITAMGGGAAMVLSCSPVRAADARHVIPAWRMTGIIDNSRAPRG